MSPELKIKYLSIAEESRLIRKEEQKQKKAARASEGKVMNLPKVHSGMSEEEKEAVIRVRKRVTAAKKNLFNGLSEEEKTLRMERAKDFRKNYEALRVHRLGGYNYKAGRYEPGLRPLLRTVHLARMFLKGVPYSAVEEYSKSSPNWVAVYKEALKFAEKEKGFPGDNKFKDDFFEWVGAKVWGI